MAWTTPTVIEVCCGMEITHYLPADGAEPILF
jgi:coenzyme PQQ precursor peptide PqqA